MRLGIRLGLLSLMFLSAVLGGQPTMSGIPEVDSAGVARAAWARANRAAAAKDIPTAYAEATRAATAWPVQPAYLWGRIVMGLSAGDTAEVLRGLRDYAAMGLGRDLSRDARFAGLAGNPWYTGLAERLQANVADLSASRVIAVVSDSTFWPEGIDFDPRTRTYYVTSLAHRTIGAIHGLGYERRLWTRDRPDIGRIFAVRVDTARDILYATMARRDTFPAAILQVDPATGAIARRFVLPAGSADATPGDILVLTDGRVAVTDSRNGVLHLLAPASGQLRTIRHPFLHSPQGMVSASDGESLIVADNSMGLLRVNLRTDVVTRFRDAPASTSVGLDGIARDGSDLIAVQNGVAPPRVVRIQLDERSGAIASITTIDRRPGMADEPTNGVIVDGEFVYIANSQWDKRDSDGNPLPDAVLRRPILLGVRLRR